MHNFHSTLTSDELQIFEDAFDFRINAPLRDFLLSHNGESRKQYPIRTTIKQRHIASILDFSQDGSGWVTNKRMRKVFGKKEIIIGTDKSDNFLCLQRDLRKQSFVIWNHITNSFEECPDEIPFVLLQWHTMP